MLRAFVSPEHLITWQFYLFLYLSISIGSHIELSPPDIKGAASGFLTLVVLVLVFNLATLWIGDVAGVYVILISQSYTFFYAIMLFAMVLNLALLILFTLLYGLKRIFIR